MLTKIGVAALLGTIGMAVGAARPRRTSIGATGTGRWR